MPAVVITGFSPETIPAKELGVKGILAKPFGKEEFLRTLERAVAADQKG